MKSRSTKTSTKRSNKNTISPTTLTTTIDEPANLTSTILSTAAATTTSTKKLTTSSVSSSNYFPPDHIPDILDESESEQFTNEDISLLNSPNTSSTNINTINNNSSSSSSSDVYYFELDDAYYKEIRRRAEILVTQRKATFDMDIYNENHGYHGLLKRKYGHVWQTRLMYDRITLNAGYFDHPVLAAVAYDVAQTFLRPILKNGNGISIELNFPDSITDCRIHPMLPTRENSLRIVPLAKPGIPIEEGHFWRTDEYYYKEIKRRSDIILQELLEQQQQRQIEGEGDKSSISITNIANQNYIGMQKHKRRLDPNSEIYSYEAKLIYRRKWFYLGRFRTAIEAAVAYDYGTTFMRPHALKNDRTKATINFPGSVSDCRVEGPIDPWPAHVQATMHERPLPPPQLIIPDPASISASPLQPDQTTEPDGSGPTKSKRKRINSDSTSGILSSTIARSSPLDHSNNIPSTKGNDKNTGGSSSAGKSNKQTKGKSRTTTTEPTTVSENSSSSLLRNRQHNVSSNSIHGLLAAAQEIQSPVVQNNVPTYVTMHSLQTNPLTLGNGQNTSSMSASLMYKNPNLVNTPSGYLNTHNGVINRRREDSSMVHIHSITHDMGLNVNTGSTLTSSSSVSSFVPNHNHNYLNHGHVSAFTPRTNHSSHTPSEVNSPFHARKTENTSTLVSPVKPEEILSTTMGALNALSTGSHNTLPSASSFNNTSNYSGTYRISPPPTDGSLRHVSSLSNFLLPTVSHPNDAVHLSTTSSSVMHNYYPNNNNPYYNSVIPPMSLQPYYSNPPNYNPNNNYNQHFYQHPPPHNHTNNIFVSGPPNYHHPVYSNSNSNLYMYEIPPNVDPRIDSRNSAPNIGSFLTGTTGDEKNIPLTPTLTNDNTGNVPKPSLDTHHLQSNTGNSLLSLPSHFQPGLDSNHPSSRNIFENSSSTSISNMTMDKNNTAIVSSSETNNTGASENRNTPNINFVISV